MDGHGPIACSNSCDEHRPKPYARHLEAALGYSFADKSLLEQALTHISALAGPRRLDSYQRLEFLGDRVLGLAVCGSSLPGLSG